MCKYIDFNGLLERTMDDKEIAFEILTCYLEETKKSLVSLRTATENKDLTESREKAHEIKGSSASTGATEMHRLAEIAQKESENGDLSAVVELVNKLETVFLETESEIKGILD